jgi:diaminopimelate decarboxylase
VTFGCEPIPRLPESVLSIDGYVEHVVARVEAHFAARGRPAPRIVLEPGRALLGDAQMLLCRVMALRDPDETGLRWAVLDAGLHVAEPVGSEFHQLFPLAPRNGAPRRLYRLSGPSCMLSDQLYPAWRLPELSVGDGLAIMDSGAYFVPFSSCFSHPRPAVVALSSSHEEVLRRAEKFDDLIALDVAGDRAVAPSRAGRPEGTTETARSW